MFSRNRGKGEGAIESNPEVFSSGDQKRLMEGQPSGTLIEGWLGTPALGCRAPVQIPHWGQ